MERLRNFPVPIILFLGIALTLLGSKQQKRLITFLFHKDQYRPEILTVESTRIEIFRSGDVDYNRYLVDGTLSGEEVVANAESLGYSPLWIISSPQESAQHLAETFKRGSQINILVNSQLTDLNLRIVDFKSYVSLNWWGGIVRILLWNSLILFGVGLFLWRTRSTFYHQQSTNEAE